MHLTKIQASELKTRLATGGELSVVDVRDHEDFVRRRTLAAVHLPYDRLDIEAPLRLPRRSTPIVLIDGHAGLAAPAAELLEGLGFTDISTLHDGMAGWEAAGLPVFEDVNTASKVFGEVVEASYHTPNISARALSVALAGSNPPVVIDCRPREEHAYGHIPGALHVPGGELVRRIRSIVPNADRPIVVHCGGRTRGILSAQSLINAGVPNPVQVLTNGTMGWHLDGLPLEKGVRPPEESHRGNEEEWASHTSERLARRFGVAVLDRERFAALLRDHDQRTLLLFHLITHDAMGPSPAGFTPVLGGQLIQATDEYVATHNAKIVLTADHMVDAVTTASWLIQMGWPESYVLPRSGIEQAMEEFGYAHTRLESVASVRSGVSVSALETLLQHPSTRVIDIGASHLYVRGHIPGAAFAPRRTVTRAMTQSGARGKLVITCPDGRAAQRLAAAVRSAGGISVLHLEGGTRAWIESGRRVERGPTAILASTSWLRPALQDAWRGREDELIRFVEWELERFADEDPGMPIETAMRGYLEWEIALLHRWREDGTLRFAIA